MKNSSSCARVPHKRSQYLKIWSFQVVVLLVKAKKCTKSYNARAKRLFWLIKFCGVHVAVAVVLLSNEKTRNANGKNVHVTTIFPPFFEVAVSS